MLVLYTDIDILLELYPNGTWNYDGLSGNEALSYHTIKRILHKLNPAILARNKNMPIDEIIKYKENIILNPNFSWELVKKCGLTKYVQLISYAPYLTMENILERNDWDWTGIIINPNITFDDCKLLRDKGFPFVYDNISIVKSITMEDILSHPEIDWNYKQLSANKNLPWDKLLKENHIYNWELLSQNTAITEDIVKNNMDKPWRKSFLASHPNLSPNFLLSIGITPLVMNPNYDWIKFKKDIEKGIYTTYTILSFNDLNQKKYVKVGIDYIPLQKYTILITRIVNDFCERYLVHDVASIILSYIF